MSTRVWESDHVLAPSVRLWALLRDLDLAKIAPSRCQSSVLTGGSSPQEVGSTREVTFKDGSKWTLRLTELSEASLTLSWDVIASGSPLGFTSRSDSIQVRKVTEDNTSFIEWTSDFSSDASVEVRGVLRPGRPIEGRAAAGGWRRLDAGTRARSPRAQPRVHAGRPMRGGRWG